MRFAVSVPNFVEYADPRAVATLASEAEHAGWDGVFVWDHLLVWNGSVVADPWTIHGGRGLLAGEPFSFEAGFVTGERGERTRPFDMVSTGLMPDRPREAVEMARELASFGVTWWQVSPGYGEGVDASAGWIRPGPPAAPRLLPCSR